MWRPQRYFVNRRNREGRAAKILSDGEELFVATKRDLIFIYKSLFLSLKGGLKMFFESLKRILRAVKAELTEDAPPETTALKPEMFNLTLERVVSMDVILRVLKRVCYRVGAKMKIIDYRRADINVPSRVIVFIISQKTKFKAIIMVEDVFVSFVALP